MIEGPSALLITVCVMSLTAFELPGQNANQKLCRLLWKIFHRQVNVQNQ